jgi:ribosomal protein S18 acetylase RimI-like enzyme
MRVPCAPEDRTIQPATGLTLHVRPLRHGEARTVMHLFERLSERSRRARFNGAKPCLNRSELRRLASIDRDRHALVAYAEGDPEPVAIARLVRDGHSAEVAFAVADDYHQLGIGSALVAELVADARAAGIREINALVARDNSAALAIVRRVARVLAICFDGPDLTIRAAITDR